MSAVPQKMPLSTRQSTGQHRALRTLDSHPKSPRSAEAITPGAQYSSSLTPPDNLKGAAVADQHDLLRWLNQPSAVAARPSTITISTMFSSIKICSATIMFAWLSHLDSLHRTGPRQTHNLIGR
jgi:hypothetical protein